MTPTQIFWTVLAAGSGLCACAALGVLVNAFSRFVHYATLGYLAQEAEAPARRQKREHRWLKRPGVVALAPLWAPVALLWRLARWLVSPLPEKRKP